MSILSYKTLLCGAFIVALSACSDNDDDMDSMEHQSYRIKITNLTNAQPLSPSVALLHDSGFSFWKVGEAASVALETMAEGGDGSALLALSVANPQHADTAALAPGASTEFILEMKDIDDNYLSVAGMLVNTNDAFSGISGVALGNLDPGQKLSLFSYTFDAGTEMNSETAGTIPGPADGGEGFNAARDDVTSVVTLHSGIVSVDDNHATSTLSEADKFDNPTLRIEVLAL